MGGGYWLAFAQPWPSLGGAQGFWAAAAAGLLLATAGLIWVQRLVERAERPQA